MSSPQASKLYERVSTLSISDPEVLLRQVQWYWADITRAEASEKLFDTPDGTFLVRNSTTPGEYTLVLRKNGSNKCIKILKREGKYGFAEPCIFDSVLDLVQHYQLHSLQIHNISLDIKLLYPFCRAEHSWLTVEDESDDLHNKLSKLVSVNKTYLDTLKNFDVLHQKYNFVTQELQRSHLAMDAMEKIRVMLEEQQKLQKGLQLELHQGDVCKLQDNYEYLQMRLTSLQRSCDQQRKDTEDMLNQLHRFINDICNLKPEVKRLSGQREEMRRNVLNEGLTVDFVDGLLEEEKGVNLCHYNKKSWFVNCDRKGAEKMLQGSPHGTFLLRPKPEEPNLHALSVVCKDEIKHCIVMYIPGRGYGFTAELCLFDSLTELVIKYRRISLAEHNSGADVTLVYPVYYYKNNEK